jgi:hypothetical protein
MIPTRISFFNSRSTVNIGLTTTGMQHAIAFTTSNYQQHSPIACG